MASEDLRRLAGVGGQGLLDEQFVPAIHGGQRRGRVVVLVRQDHRGVYFRPAEQLVERRREIVGVGLLRQFAPGLFADVAKAEPADARILACALGANAANGAAADNGKTDGFVAVAHSVPFRICREALNRSRVPDLRSGSRMVPHPRSAAASTIPCHQTLDLPRLKIPS